MLMFLIVVFSILLVITSFTICFKIYNYFKNKYIGVYDINEKFAEISQFIKEYNYTTTYFDSSQIVVLYKNIEISYYSNLSRIIIYSLIDNDRLLVADCQQVGIFYFILKGPWKKQYAEFSKEFRNYKKNRLKKFKMPYYQFPAEKKYEKNQIII